MSSRVVSPPFFSIVSSLHLTMILVKPRSPRPRPLGVPQDYAEAAKWYRLAAEQNNAAAQYNLSLMYANGQGVPRDDGEAVKWLRKAGDQGYVSAQIDLSLTYANGWGAPELMCRVQREKTGIRGSAGVYCGRARAKMEILAILARVHGGPPFQRWNEIIGIACL